MSIKEAKKIQIRERILETAKKEFIEKGYKETTISKIAAKAGIGKGTVFNYFSSKNALILECYYKLVPTNDKLTDFLGGLENKKDRVHSIIDNSFINLLQLDREIMRGSLMALFDDRVTESKFVELNDNVISALCEALKIKEDNRRDRIQGELIFTSCYEVFLSYALDSEMTKDRYKEKIRDRVDYLLYLFLCAEGQA